MTTRQTEAAGVCAMLRSGVAENCLLLQDLEKKADRGAQCYSNRRKARSRGSCWATWRPAASTRCSWTPHAVQRATCAGTRRPEASELGELLLGVVLRALS